MTMFARLKESYTTMNPTDRRLLVISIAVTLGLLVLYGGITQHIHGLALQRVAKDQALQELLSLRQRHREAAMSAQQLTNRIAAVSTGDTPASIIEQSGILPKGGIQVKPLPQQDQGSYIENSALITLNGLSLNEMINLLYRLEQNSKPVAIKQVNLRTRFNDPSRLDVTLQLSLMRLALPHK